MTKSKKYIWAKKSIVFRAKNLAQLGTFFTLSTRLLFIEAPILNYFDSKSYIYIETNIFNYTIDKIFS